MSKICVFCGSSMGVDDIYSKKAIELADYFIENGHTLVYGGANVGLMKVIADRMLEAGKEVIGVMPQHLVDKEVAHHGISKLHVVESMAKRKDLLIEISDSFIAMPGGFGTLDELFEAMTLIQTHKIEKFPIILVGTKFWEGLLDWVKTTLLESFGNISAKDLDLIHLVDTEDEVVGILDSFYNGSELSPNF